MKEIWSPRSLYDGIWRHGYDWIVRFFKTIFVKKPSCEVPGGDLATLYRYETMFQISACSKMPLLEDFEVIPFIIEAAI